MEWLKRVRNEIIEIIEISCEGKSEPRRLTLATRPSVAAISTIFAAISLPVSSS